MNMHRRSRCLILCNASSRLYHSVPIDIGLSSARLGLEAYNSKNTSGTILRWSVSPRHQDGAPQPQYHFFAQAFKCCGCKCCNCDVCLWRVCFNRGWSCCVLRAWLSQRLSACWSTMGWMPLQKSVPAVEAGRAHIEMRSVRMFKGVRVPEWGGR